MLRKTAARTCATIVFVFAVTLLLACFHGSLITGKRKGCHQISTENGMSRPSRSEGARSHEETCL